jgi:hypothetical protein
MARVGAVQIWPEWNVQVEPMPLTAASMSASSNTMPAPLPPSSSSWRFIVRPPVEAISMPTFVLPVKLTMSTSGESTRAWPLAGVLPVTMLTTPGGNPASRRMSTSAITASGSCDAGRTTTVLPIASAGPSFPAMLTIGKLYDVMQATTPTGTRRAIAPIRAPGASGVVGISDGGSGITVGSSAPTA